MRLRSTAFALLVLTGCQPPAEQIYTNATVYTSHDAQPTAEAVAVTGGKVVFVGSAADAERYQGPSTEVVDLAGAVVFPGFIDAHAHLSGVGQRELMLNLEGSLSVAELQRRVKERVDRAQPGEWVVGRGWIETHWTPTRFPTRQDLDAISPNNPVALQRADGHALVANSAALKLAGVTRATQPPSGGDILKDARGEPTGMLIDAAEGLVGRHIPAETEESRENHVVVGADRYVKLGWTQLHDAGGSWPDLARLRKLFQEGRVTLRVYKTLNGPSESADSLLANGAFVNEFDGRLTIRTIKVVMDGALGSRGALLLAPYSDDPGRYGLLTTDLAQLRPMLAEAMRRGVQVEAHAIGDSANRLYLNLVEETLAAVPASERALPEHRWRNEHSQIVNPADIPRFATLGVIPSMQPSHAIGDLYFAPSRLGTERLVGAYAWKDFVDQGNMIAAGSDAPVEQGHPMIEFYAAVARKDTTGFQGAPEVWHPEQALTREQALKALTLWPAYAAFEELERGSIEVGKWADFTILDADIMKIPEAEILKTRTVMTVINGAIAYRAP